MPVIYYKEGQLNVQKTALSITKYYVREYMHGRKPRVPSIRYSVR